MPLPRPQNRKLMHTRVIDCKGYEREDGLWDIEGRLIDAKTFDHAWRDGDRELQPGEYVHEMFMRLTVDLDFRIHDIVTATDAAPFAPC